MENKITRLKFTEPPSSEQIEKLVDNQVKEIIFSYDDYQNIYDVISKLNNNDIDKIIEIKDKTNFPVEKFMHFDNVKVDIDKTIYSMAIYAQGELILRDLVEDINNSTLSPLEKYLAVYDIVKKYKEYKENPYDELKSRKLYDVLTNEYIVCVGFANLLKELLDRIEIKSKDSHVVVILPGDDLENFDAGHARVLVYLNDPKYNLKGYFIADPTWDNEMNDEFYNYALMTPHEREFAHVITYSSDNIYGVETKEELEKLNGLMDRFINNTKYFDPKAYDELFSQMEKENTDELDGLEKMIREVTRDLKKLSAKLGVREENNNDDKIDYEKVFNYIKENTCKEIKGTTIIDAAMEVYKFKNPNYTIEEYQNYRQKLIKSNFERQEKAFPKLERYNDETYEVMGGEHNKFSR